MTREEAINFLKGYLDEEVYTEKCRNAHEMAIKALEQEPTTKENLAVAELGEDLRKTRTAICNKKVLIGFNLAIAVMNKHLGGKE